MWYSFIAWLLFVCTTANSPIFDEVGPHCYHEVADVPVEVRVILHQGDDPRHVTQRLVDERVTKHKLQVMAVRGT